MPMPFEAILREVDQLDGVSERLEGLAGPRISKAARNAGGAVPTEKHTSGEAMSEWAKRRYGEMGAIRNVG